MPSGFPATQGGTTRRSAAPGQGLPKDRANPAANLGGRARMERNGMDYADVIPYTTRHNVSETPSMRRTLGVAQVSLSAAPRRALPADAAATRGRAPGLRSQLVLLAATILLPLLALTVFVTLRGLEAARTREEVHLQLQANLVALTVEREFAAISAVVRTLAGSRALGQPDMGGFLLEMRAAAAIMPDASIGLAGSDGQQTLLTLLPGDGMVPPGNLANAAAMAALRSGRMEISDLYRGPRSGLLQVALAVPVAATVATRQAAVVNLVLPARHFDGLLKRIRMPEAWTTTLIDRHNIVIARSEGGAEFSGGPAPNAARTATTQDLALVRGARLDGVPSILAFARGETTGFRIIVTIPQRVFDAPIRQAMQEILAIGALLSLVALGCALLLGIRIIAAIQDLALPGTPPHAGRHFREVDEIAARLRSAERWRVVLMAEMNHRVKNTLMTVQALAAETLKGTRHDPAAFQRQFVERLVVLSRAHDLLSATGWQAAPIDAVAAAALAPWLAGRDRAIRITMQDGFDVAPRQAQALILGLHELATNAAKHGALAAAGGRVGLQVALAADGTARLTWTETGGPAPSGPPARSGFGTRLLHRVLPRDLGPGATVARHFEPPGLRAVISFRPAPVADTLDLRAAEPHPARVGGRSRIGPRLRGWLRRRWPARHPGPG